MKDLNGNRLTGVLGITFALYSEQTGGAPLWLETQNVQADVNGRYSILLGSTKPEGLPAELFTSEQARWVGVQVSGQAEQPRVLLVSAPYALKAGDAETVGGLPPSAFVMVAPPAVGSATASASAASKAVSASPAMATDVTTTGGKADYLPVFSGSSAIVDSVVYQTGTGSTAKVGIGTTKPRSILEADVAGAFEKLGPTITLTNTAGGTSAGASIDFNTFTPSTKGTYNPSSRIEAVQYGDYSDSILFQSNKGGATNNGLQTNLTILATGQVGIGTTAPAHTLDVNGNGNFSNGVSGQSSAVGADGVYGNNSATSGTGTNGVYGSTSSPAGAGTVGVNFSSGGYGVYGQSNGTATGSTAVYGTAAGSSATGPTYGVYGTTSGTASGSTGVYGVANGTVFDKPIYGVYGVIPSAIFGAAVAGTSTGISSIGSDYLGAGAGVWGDAKPDLLLYGVLGTSDDGIAAYALNNTGSDTSTPALSAWNDSDTTGALIFEANNPYIGGQCTINVNGDLKCNGTITPTVHTTKGQQVELYGVASPENWFEDFGSGQLSGGSAKVPLDPTFASTVDTGEAYHVFLTPNGDCKGLYVASKTAGGFEVRELGGGASSTFFDYRIVAKRRGYEGVRMKDVTEQMNKIQERQARMRAKSGNVGPTSAPHRPVAPELTPGGPEQAQPARVSSLKTPPAPLK